MPDNNEEDERELQNAESEVSHVREACNMSVQVSMMEDTGSEMRESDDATSPGEYQNMSLQVSIAESDDCEIDVPDVTTNDMALQVSMAAGQSSDEDEENTKDLALRISVVSDPNTTSELRNRSNMWVEEPHAGNVEETNITSDSPLQDAQQDSLLTSDHDETQLSNESSARSNEGEKTVFQTPPEVLPTSKLGRNVSSGTSPTLTAYKTTKQHLNGNRPDIHNTKRKSIGLLSSSFCVPSSAASPDDVQYGIPHMVLSDEEDDGTSKSKVRVCSKYTTL